MKQAISLLLALLILLSFSACGSKALVVSSNGETPALNAAFVNEYIDRVKLTVDNWSDYIKVYSYDIEVVEKDAFGELTKAEKLTVFRLGYGTDRYHYLDATIELKHKQTGEIIVYGNGGRSCFLDTNSFDLNQYECTRIKGYLYFINYPEDVFEEVLNVSDRRDKEYANAEIKVAHKYFIGTWRVDCDAKTIQNATKPWSDYFE